MRVRFVESVLLRGTVHAAGSTVELDESPALSRALANGWASASKSKSQPNASTKAPSGAPTPSGSDDAADDLPESRSALERKTKAELQSLADSLDIEGVDEDAQHKDEMVDALAASLGL